MSDLAIYAMVLAAAAATYVWRFLGIAVANRIDDRSLGFRFVRAVATAMVAGLAARMVLFPTGGLAAIPLALRLAAVGAGAGAYAATGRSVTAGLIAADAVIIMGAWWLGLGSG
ncbi:AzlD domain-containing protein [Blastochloris sulfoviridis]|uniref:AzlD domain-containing protein n=1 Tax=Blastochloris sulfoviridis TaxID=50712 RepID=A0A5M6I1E0_9HYPH|nr:AzlD domain-containing protein [Blastochloris sulfoviridis]KAA5601990.1 AzlD domain-containing protein [Blastochloris sulfoviridis]